jgi:predicted DCC family thiol-disulfide oxidoreductase YuxK
MAMGVQVDAGARMRRTAGSSWNPLRCGGLELPTNLVIMVKAIAIALLLTRHFLLLPDPFLPFIPGMDLIPGAWFQRGMQALMVGSAVALLFNVRVRLTSFLLGMSLLLSVVASKAYYGNNKTFCGLMLVLASLHQPGRSPWMLRLQLVVVYFGAGLNKILDPDWRSGVFMHNWVANRLHQPLFVALEPLLPALALAKLMSWLTIVTELGLSIALLVRRLYPLGIWLAILLHSGMLLFTGSTFTLFFYGMTAAMLAFVDWPSQPLTVIYDGDCGFCDATRRFFERLDLEETFRWVPAEANVLQRFGITEEMARERVYLAGGGRAVGGFRAFRRMLLYNPAAYVLTYAVLAAPGPRDSTFRNVLVAILLVLFSPLFTPVGEAFYRVLARNRHRLMGNSQCIPR